MFKKETEYALRGLVYIQIQNQNNRRPGITEIATEVETPPHFMAKILQRMVRLGFLASVKGKNGGYTINSENGSLSLRQVISAIEGSALFEGCGFGLKHCDENNPCPLHYSYAPIRDAINKLVNQETIQSLAGEDPNTLDFVLSRK
ncbi:Rrf2 family transcriptional regulator [uncultured Draconibacterium sp.]|uniref:RrF2 family transcriptional regulator n=1 Tax=uncultured Draconibacterium sp. TaxID=1573823 RepID=UPI003217A8BB